MDHRHLELTRLMVRLHAAGTDPDAWHEALEAWREVLECARPVGPPGLPPIRDMQRIEAFARAVCDCARGGGAICAAPDTPGRNRHGICLEFGLHLMHAAEAAVRSDREEGAAHAYRELADHLPPTWLTGARGDVLQHNLAAQSSECGLFVDGAGLIALPERSATGRLRQAIAAVQDERLFAWSDAAGTVRRLLLKRLPKASNGKGYYALVLLDDVGQAHRDIARLARLFGFTAKQGELASLLLAGMSVTQAASRMGISRSTAADHMRLLFDKTHTARQSELVRVLARAASL